MATARVRTLEGGAIDFTGQRLRLPADEHGNPEETVDVVERRRRLQTEHYEYAVKYIDGPNAGRTMWETQATLCAASKLPAPRARRSRRARVEQNYAELVGRVPSPPAGGGGAAAPGAPPRIHGGAARGTARAKSTHAARRIVVRIPIARLSPSVAAAISPFNPALSSASDEETRIAEHGVVVRRARWEASAALGADEIFAIDSRSEGYTEEDEVVLSLRRAHALASALREHAVGEAACVADYIDAAGEYAAALLVGGAEKGVEGEGVEGDSSAMAPKSRGAVAAPAAKGGGSGAAEVESGMHERDGAALAVLEFARASAPTWATLLRLARADARASPPPLPPSSLAPTPPTPPSAHASPPPAQESTPHASDEAAVVAAALAALVAAVANDASGDDAFKLERDLERGRATAALLNRLRCATTTALDLGDVLTAWRDSLAAARMQLATTVNAAESELSAAYVAEEALASKLRGFPNLMHVNATAAALLAPPAAARSEERVEGARAPLAGRIWPRQ